MLFRINTKISICLVSKKKDGTTNLKKRPIVTEKKRKQWNQEKKFDKNCIIRISAPFSSRKRSLKLFPDILKH